jgi:glycosyltransferase involved in cell wall biosynthesis
VDEVNAAARELDDSMIRETPHLLLVGHLPPNGIGAGGQATQFAVVLEAIKKRRLRHSTISLFPGAHTGRPTIRRALELLGVLSRYVMAVRRRSLAVYLSIAKSRQGFARDAIMIWIGKLRGHRIVAHLNEGAYDEFYARQPGWLKAVIRATLRRADAIVVVSDRFLPMFDFEPSLVPKLTVVPNPTPWSSGSKCQPKTLDPSIESIRVLFLSLMIESKGYLDVLEATAIAVNQLGLDVEAHFAGPFATNASDDRTVKSVGQAEKQFHDLVVKYGLGTRVVYHGPVFGQPKEELLRRAHVLALPTWFDREAQPLCILEAMAFGCPVIATRHRAIPDMLEPEHNGLFVDTNDPAGIAAALARLVADPTLYKRMSQAAIKRASDFDPRAHAESIISLVSAGDRPAGRSPLASSNRRR